MIKLGIDYECVSGIIFDKKSYVLKRADGKLILKGNTLKSRKMEPFCREFINKCVNHILESPEDYQIDCFLTYREFKSKIENNELPASAYAQRGMLNMELDDYLQRVAAGQTNMTAMYEAALQSDRNLRKGDVIYFYISDPGMEWVTVRKKEVYRKAKRKASEKAKLILDMNQEVQPDTDHYVKRLEQAAKRFMALEHFDEMFGIKLKPSELKKLENLHNLEIEEEDED